MHIKKRDYPLKGGRGDGSIEWMLSGVSGTILNGEVIQHRAHGRPVDGEQEVIGWSKGSKAEEIKLARNYVSVLGFEVYKPE